MINHQSPQADNFGTSGTTARPRPPRLEQELMEIDSAAFAWRVALWMTLMVVGFWLSMQSGAWLIAGGIFLLGIAMTHGVELSHQALHYTGFRSRLLNEIFGVAMGLPMLVSFYEYRINHLKHHALLGTPMNREFFDYGSDTWTLKGLALRFLMLHHYMSFFKKLVRTLFGLTVGDYHIRHRGKVRLFYMIATLALAALAFTCWLSNSLDPLLIWLAALVFVASPLHALIEMPEHYGCNENSTDAFENTRTVKSNWFMAWFTNYNNFHVEHHIWVNAPIQKLHLLHARCRDKSKYLNIGYWQFYISALRNARASINTQLGN